MGSLLTEYQLSSTIQLLIGMKEGILGPAQTLTKAIRMSSKVSLKSPAGNSRVTQNDYLISG